MSFPLPNLLSRSKSTWSCTWIFAIAPCLSSCFCAHIPTATRSHSALIIVAWFFYSINQIVSLLFWKPSNDLASHSGQPKSLQWPHCLQLFGLLSHPGLWAFLWTGQAYSHLRAFELALFFCLECSSQRASWLALAFFRLKCHLIREAFLDHTIYNCNCIPSPGSLQSRSLLYLPPQSLLL